MPSAKPVEACDPTTGKPVAYYETFLAAEAAGYVRASIHRCLVGSRKTHRGLTWRIAPPEALTSAFVAEFTRPAAGTKIEYSEFMRRFRDWSPRPLYSVDVLGRLKGLGIRVATVVLNRFDVKNAYGTKTGQVLEVDGLAVLDREWA